MAASAEELVALELELLLSVVVCAASPSAYSSASGNQFFVSGSPLSTPSAYPKHRMDAS